MNCKLSWNYPAACMELERHSYGFEIKKDFCKKAKGEMLVFKKDEQMTIEEFIS